MTGFIVGGGDGGAGIIFGVKNTVLQITPAQGLLAYTTDTGELFLGTGSQWVKVPFALVPDTSAPDIGYLQNSSRIGYGTDYVSDKRIANSIIGDNVLTTEGAIRTRGGKLQIYLNGTWNDVVIGFRLREDSAEGYQFEHQPIGFTEWIEIMSGNSNTLGLNGLPLTQGYKTVMGAYGVPLVITGGTF